MGTLIVLLVLVVQQARVYASTQSKPNADKQTEAEEHEELQLEKEDFLWRRDIQRLGFTRNAFF